MAQILRGKRYMENITIDELVNLYRKEKNCKGSIRLLCAIHRKKGKSITEIAEISQVPVSTVSDHLRRLLNDFNSLHDKRVQHRPPKLTAEEQQQLIVTIRDPPHQNGYPAIVWTTKMILHYIQEEFGIKFTSHGIRKLLYRENFVRLKPRPYHAKGNKKQQIEFKKNYPESLRNICKMDMRSSFWMNQDSS